MMKRFAHFLSAINDTTILHAAVAQLIIETAQTARYRGTPAANAQFTMCGK